MSTEQKPVAEKPESIRQWYNRTTSKMRSWLAVMTAFSIIGGVTFFCLVPHTASMRLQTFNGAITIPIAALIWILAFVYIFLVPSREVGFRGQESIEQTVDLLNTAVKKNIEPALEIWQRIGKRMEEELNSGLLDQIKGTIKDLRDATSKITNSAETSNGELKKVSDDTKKFVEDAKPAIDALKRIQERIESGLSGSFVDDLQAAVASMKHLSLPPPGENLAVKEPKVDKALTMISKKPSPKVPPPPLVVPAAPVETPAQIPLPVAVQTPIQVQTSVPVPIQNSEGGALPVAVPVQAQTSVPAPIQNPERGVMPPSIPVMVPTQAQAQVPVSVTPVAQGPSAVPAPASRFAPAPAVVPTAPVMQGPGSFQPAGSPMGQTIQVVLPSSRQAPQASPQIPVTAPVRQIPPPPKVQSPDLGSRGLRPGSVELPLTQKSKPVVVTPIHPQTQPMGVVMPSGPVQMVAAPHIIHREG